MLRCPICNGRLGETPSCGRCGSDLSPLLKLEQRAVGLEARSVRQLARGELEEAAATVAEVLIIKASPHARSLQAFIDTLPRQRLETVADEPSLLEMDVLIGEITTATIGEDEGVNAFQHAFETSVSLPTTAYVIGEAILVLGLLRAGTTTLLGRCRKEDGREYLISLQNMVFAEGTEAQRHHAAYRKWLGLDPPAVAVSRSAGIG